MKWIVLVTLFCGVVFSISCTTTTVVRKTPPSPAAPSVHAIYNSAQRDLQEGRRAAALQKLEVILREHRGTDVYDRAALLMGDIYFEGRDFERARRAYMLIPQGNYQSELEPRALYQAAQSLLRLQRTDEALSLIDQSLRRRDLSDTQLTNLHQLRLRILEDQGRMEEVLRSLVGLSVHHDDASQREAFRIRAIEIVEGRLNENELERIARSSDFGYVRVYALYRLGEFYIEQRETDRARRAFRGVIDLLPESDLAESAEAVLHQLDAIRRVQPRTIGVILPLTGRHANLAQRSLRGIEMALGLHGPNSSQFQIAVIDSETSADSARRAVERLVTEDNVIAIIGSMLSRTAVPVAAKADELGVPSIALSQRSGVTEVGERVFRNAITSEMQVRQLVKTAMEELGQRRFAILYPNDSYGVEYANVFWDEVLARGGSIKGAQTYDPSETDFNQHIQRLVGTYFVEDREAEFQELMRNWLDQRGGRRSARTRPPEDLLPPIIEFDALFIPDGGRALGQIAPMLLYNGVRDITLLGTNLWNNEAAIRRAGNMAEALIFVDGLTESLEGGSHSSFIQEYQEIFGERPGLFELQAYDSALLLRQLISEGADNRDRLARRLQNVQDFPGAIGPLSIGNNREIERPLGTFMVRQGKILPFSRQDILQEQKNL